MYVCDFASCKRSYTSEFSLVEHQKLRKHFMPAGEQPTPQQPRSMQLPSSDNQISSQSTLTSEEQSMPAPQQNVLAQITQAPISIEQPILLQHSLQQTHVLDCEILQETAGLPIPENAVIDAPMQEEHTSPLHSEHSHSSSRYQERSPEPSESARHHSQRQHPDYRPSSWSSRRGPRFRPPTMHQTPYHRDAFHSSDFRRRSRPEHRITH